MNRKIIAELIFVVTLLFSITGGFLLSKNLFLLGILSIAIGFVILFFKWKYEDKIKEVK